MKGFELMKTDSVNTMKPGFLRIINSRLKRDWQLYMLMFLPLTYIIIFKYVPIFGLQIAFREYDFRKGIWDSPWVGLQHFRQFFSSPNFIVVIGNTLRISVLTLLINFPAPILLALFLNEIRDGIYKKTVQMVTYAPHFISTVVMCGMIILFLSPSGKIGDIYKLFNQSLPNYLASAANFKFIYSFTEMWQHTGYGSVIYLAALSSINPELYESAKIDGASRLNKIMHIDIPGILPVIIILLILNTGNVLNVGFEKIFLLQNPLNMPGSEVISTYVYKIGLVNANYSFSAAVGFFNSVITFIVLALVNWIAGRLTEYSLW